MTYRQVSQIIEPLEYPSPCVTLSSPSPTEKSWYSLSVDSVSSWIRWFVGRTLKAGGPIPRHIAFIMDGNRRFARKVKKDVTSGHDLGGMKLKQTLEWCLELGILHVSAFAFSIENFKRSKEEVDGLMNLARKKLMVYIPELSKKTKIQFLGDISLLPHDLQCIIADAIEQSKNITGSTLNICFAYTSTDEIRRATQTLAQGVKRGLINSSDIDNTLFESCLDSHGVIEPDIIVRTSGEIRLSDFMLWQSSYSCLVFCDVLWPEFNIKHLYTTILNYQKNYQHMEELRKLYKKSQQKEKSEEDNKNFENHLNSTNEQGWASRIVNFISWKDSLSENYIQNLITQKNTNC